MSDVSIEEVHQYLKELHEEVPNANSLDRIALRAAIISFVNNKKKRKINAEYCKTYNKEQNLNSNTDMGHSSRDNNTTHKFEKQSRAEYKRQKTRIMLLLTRITSFHVYVLWSL